MKYEIVKLGETRKTIEHDSIEDAQQEVVSETGMSIVQVEYGGCGNWPTGKGRPKRVQQPVERERTLTLSQDGTYLTTLQVVKIRQMP